MRVEDVNVEMVVQMVESNGVMWVLPEKKKRKEKKWCNVGGGCVVNTRCD
jgi:hypothetical protein